MTTLADELEKELWWELKAYEEMLQERSNDGNVIHLNPRQIDRKALLILLCYAYEAGFDQGYYTKEEEVE